MQSFPELITFLEFNVTNVFKWFHENGLANSCKSHYLISPYETKSIQIQSSCIKASFSKELLEIKIDSIIFFFMMISHLYAQKLIKTYLWVSKYMGINKRRVLIKSYTFLQCNYCSLVWMYRRRSLNNKINLIQERALQIVYTDSSFKQFFSKR